jgi:hypothetical protein
VEYPEELRRGKVPQAERTEDRECLGGWRGYLGSKGGVFVKCLCCLMCILDKDFEDGTLH